VNFPASLTSIGWDAFKGCSGITTVSLSGCTSLTSIGGNAFEECSGLTTVSLSGCTSLTSIGDYAFKGCSGLTSVSFPASLTSIVRYAFKGCSSLTSATFADATGWAVYNDWEYKNKATDIEQSDLQNKATAARYLREGYNGGGYRDKYWKKN